MKKIYVRHGKIMRIKEANNTDTSIADEIVSSPSRGALKKSDVKDEHEIFK